MRRGACLLDKIRAHTATQLNGYLDLRLSGGGGGGGDTVKSDLERIITISEHGDDAGLRGAIFLAQRAWNESKKSKGCESSNSPKDATRDKQVAFQYGLWHGFLVGAVGTALVFKYGLFGVGRNPNQRR